MAEAQVTKQLDQLRAASDEALEQAKAQGVGRDKLAGVKGRLKAELDNATREAKRQAAMNTIGPMDDARAVMQVIDAFVASDAISVRFLPCGLEHPEYALSGSLLGRDDYIQREREALFSRYGSVLHGWTSVLQVASVPEQKD